MAENGFFEGTNIPLSYVGDPSQRRRFIADIAEAGGDPRKVKSTLYDIAQASSDPHTIFSGEYGMNQPVGDLSKGSAGRTYAELATSSAAGFTDVYGDVKGPEVDIPDVDIHGYPSNWTVVEMLRVVSRLLNPVMEHILNLRKSNILVVVILAHQRLGVPKPLWWMTQTERNRT